MDTDTKNYKFLFGSDSSEYVELINDHGHKLYDYYDNNDNDNHNSNNNGNEYQYNPTSSKKKYIQPRQSYYNCRSPTLPLYTRKKSGYYSDNEIIWDENLEYYKTNKTCNTVKYCCYQICEFCLYVKDKIMICAYYVKSKCIKEKYENCENYENYEDDVIYTIHENPIKNKASKSKINLRTPLNKSEFSV